MCKKTKDNQYRYYNANLRIILWTFALLLVFAIMCIIASGISYVLYELINIIGIPIAQNGDAYGFLSGLIGIVLGFLFDLIFINRIRQILKYKKLVKTLTREFNRMLKNLYNIEINNYSEWLRVSNSLDTMDFSSIIKRGDVNLKRWAFANIMSSAEYDYIILLFNKELSSCLHYINGNILSFNENPEPANSISQLKELLKNLIEFYLHTNWKIHYAKVKGD